MERECPLRLSTVGMPQIRTGSDPSARFGVDLDCNLQSALEEGDGMGEVVLVVEHDAHFVQKQRIGLAHLVGGGEIFGGEGQVVELQVLHAEEELREVGSLKEARCGAVCGYGLVVLAFCGKGVREADPGGAEVGVHH